MEDLGSYSVFLWRVLFGGFRFGFLVFIMFFVELGLGFVFGVGDLDSDVFNNYNFFFIEV